MHFRFLGTGTSAGIPLIGCREPACACRSDDPRDRRLRTSAAIRFTDASDRERTILLDCGPDFRAQALAAGLDRCDAVLFTHNHVDHTWGVDELRRFNAVMRAPIDVYAEAPVLEHLRRVYKHIFERDLNVQDSFVATLIAHRLEADRPLELYGLRFTPIRLLHGRLPVLGFRIEPVPGSELARRASRDPQSPFPLAYCTDVSAFPPESWAKLEGLRTLVLDALRYRKHPTHLTIGQAASVAQRVGAEATWFVHMSHELIHETTDAELPEGMRLAWDGLTLGA
ncbi:MAG: MBL fold metallo-hydrolase [Phycisphaerales bacterium]|nr:MAG: MBL fold metallo-hydrolase [Phycisphaerales bacterium]